MEWQTLWEMSLRDLGPLRRIQLLVTLNPFWDTGSTSGSPAPVRVHRLMFRQADQDTISKDLIRYTRYASESILLDHLARPAIFLD
jgi:hypothetical protein